MAPPPVAAGSSAVALRMRPDLEWSAIEHGARRWWVVKDPVSQAYYHLHDEELAILQMLDGRQTLPQLRQRFESLFAPLRLSAEQLQSLLAQLHRLGLVLADRPGQGAELCRRARRRNRQELLSRAVNLLAIRLPGIDPQPLLERLGPAARWLFSPLGFALWLGLVLVAGLVLGIRHAEVAARLPDLATLTAGGNVAALAAALALAKVLHELGHALAARRYGVECHEIGILLLVFTPCLYCNVSDAWMLPSRRQRAVISAAGILVELGLAAACGLLWWASVPGPFNTMCLSLVLVCSLNTLLLNGNPLLRYDGYHIAADLLGLPNLAAQARRAAGAVAARGLLGLRLPSPRPRPAWHTAALAAYAAASTVYRWLVAWAIVWLVQRVLEPLGLAVVAQAIAAVVVAGLLVPPLAALVRAVRQPGLRQRLHPPRAVLGIGLLAAAVAAALCVPLPTRVHGPAAVQLADVRNVYVVVPGTLDDAVAPGTAVEAGDPVGRLTNLALERELLALAGQRDRAAVQYQSLRRRLEQEPDLAPLLPGLEEAMRDAHARYRQRQRDADSLVLRAPCGGRLLAPPQRDVPSADSGRLPLWHGVPQEPRNRGSYLESGTLFCQVGDPAQVEALVVIDQSEIARVQAGQRVRLRLDQRPDRVLEGTLTQLGRTPLLVLPAALAASARIPARPDEQGLPRPVGTLYQATVRLEEGAGLLPGGTGEARIRIAPQPLWRQLARALGRTFGLAAGPTP